jgi:predicted ribosome quality control (RQC) complex YloA/Tae2 family protein
MSGPGPALRGLSAAELAAACGELAAWCGAAVLDAVPLAVVADADDLLLVLQGPTGKGFLHLVPGGQRARLTLTSVRFAATTFAHGTRADLLQRELRAARLTHVAAAAGERRGALHFATPAGDRRLVFELFGARGLWALLDAEGRIVVLSRPVATAVRTLQPGDPYAPPPPAPEPRGEARPDDAELRFAAPVLAAIDAFYAPLDARAEQRRLHDVLLRNAQRALHKTKAKVQGLAQQLADTGRAAGYRERADLMLAYQHTVRRGAASMQVPDPARDGETLTLELDPALPVMVQARALYEKARRLDDGREISLQRLAAAEAEVAALQPLVDRLQALSPSASDLEQQLAELRPALQRLGLQPKSAAPAAVRGAGGAARPKHKPEPGAGENFRRFTSAEGYPIWVGRNNEQNDRLTMRIANGNDLWLHVGGGRPGSHVIVRLPKNKTASLETLLDAAVLAVHFSKARGESRIEVVYTHKKHVRKPKGLPAGAVVPAQTRSITVQREDERLRRLLDSAGPQDDDPR